MNFTLIKGTFHVVGFSPDGDSIRFRATNPANWNKIQTDKRELFEEKLAADDGAITLRLQGVDALETHYSPATPQTPKDMRGFDIGDRVKPKGGNHHQPERFGSLATAAFLEMLGVKRVEWRSWGQNTWIDKAWFEKRGKEYMVDDKYEDAISGYIITHDVEKSGRPISWVFAGKTRTRDGSNISKSSLSRRIPRSANYQLLQKGLVYPYFFMTLPASLRNKLAEAAKQAHEEAIAQLNEFKAAGERVPDDLPNLWLYDGTTQGTSVSSLHKICEESELFPYLFRRILKHWHAQNTADFWEACRNKEPYDASNNHRISLKGFYDTANPYIFVISSRDFVRLDELLDTSRNRVRMKVNPYDIVFLS